MIQAGFKPTELLYLGELALEQASWQVADMCHSLKFTVANSTYLLGIADPKSCLGPSEIHVGIFDIGLGNGSPFLEGRDALVSRHPALRRSDIQRVKIEFKPELMHLRNVVVFPTTGSYPLAGKLQGGDYDGDKFWVCWEPSLVEPFMNAPPPKENPDPAKFGIDVDKTKLREVLRRDGGTDEFFRRSFDFHWLPQLLGVCTNFHERLRYTLNTLAHDDVEAVADIHDLLVDTVKNGYQFTDGAWQDYVSSLNTQKLIEPCYKQMAGKGLADKPTSRYEPDNIIDHLIFDIARPSCFAIIDSLHHILKKTAATWDSSVLQLITHTRETFLAEKDIQTVLENLKDVFDLVYEPWRLAGMKYAAQNNDDTQALWATAKSECSRRFNVLLPQQTMAVKDEGNMSWEAVETRSEESPSHPVLRAWLQRPALHAPSQWDLIKASALFKLFHGQPNFVFTTAGRYICYLKAHSHSASHEPPEICVPTIYSYMKVRKKKAGEAFGADLEAEQVEEGAIDDDNASVLSGHQEYFDAFETFSGTSPVSDMLSQFAESSLDEVLDEKTEVLKDFAEALESDAEVLTARAKGLRNFRVGSTELSTPVWQEDLRDLLPDTPQAPPKVRDVMMGGTEDQTMAGAAAESPKQRKLLVMDQQMPTV